MEEDNVMLPDGLTREALELITKCPHLINRFAQSINELIDNWDVCDTPLEPIEITHVEYTSAECGYEK